MHEVNDMVDLQGPFFFSCQTKHNDFNNSFQEKIGKILKRAQVIYTKLFLNGPS